MDGESKTSRTKLIAAAVISLIAIYERCGPFIEETDHMKEKIKTIQKENLELRLGSEMYDRQWEKQILTKELKLEQELPNAMNSSLVLDYVMSKFEEQNRDKIRFISANHQFSVASDIRVNNGTKSKVSPRISRYKIKATIMQDLVVPYLTHIEKFTGLFTLENFNLIVPGGGGPMLEMELIMAFYLMPKEWVPAVKLIGQPEHVVSSGDQDEEENWFQIFASKATDKLVQPDRAVAQIPNRTEKYPTFKINQIVGGGIVIGEGLYEEGDTIQGWKVLRIDSEGKSVVLKKSGTIRRITVP